MFKALFVGGGFFWAWLGLAVTFAQVKERPFVLWTQEDVESMRNKLVNEPWYGELVESWRADLPASERTLFDLWQWAVEGDELAGQRQKSRLLEVARSPVPRGAAQYFNVLRYDLLYHELTEKERAEVEAFFRIYIDHAVFRNSIFDPEVFNDERNYSRYHAHYHRVDNWLPNITFPRVLSANLMAAALGDEALIKEVWDHYGSFRWYFDEYLSDGGFYGEEFSKQHATVGEILLYSRALDHLGLSELGFDYTGRHGSTVRGHVETMLRLAYPQVELHTNQPHIPRLTIGDLRGPPRAFQDLRAFQDFIVPGVLPGMEETLPRWRTHGAWGGEIRGNHPQWDGYHGFTPKMEIPYWFEMAHQQWPKAGFDYFLSLMREGDNDAYLPSPYFGLRPLLTSEAEPPRAPSWVAGKRGLVMLRAEESSKYWTSAKPAVGMRLATPYAHDVFDALAITGMVAFNRPIYVNRQIGGYARDWTRSILSQGGVKVDGMEPAFTRLMEVRHHFQPELKFVSAASDQVYPGVRANRSLFLTDSYLLDLFALADENGLDRIFRWTMHPLGQAVLGDDWSDPAPLTDKLGASEREYKTATRHRLLSDPQAILATFGEMRYQETSTDWHVGVWQTSPIPEEKRLLDPAWYDRKVGVDLYFLGSPGTTIAVGPTPITFRPEDTPDLKENPAVHEVGGMSVLVHRDSPQTTFAALHVPGAEGKRLIRSFRRIAEEENSLAVMIEHRDSLVKDLVMVQFQKPYHSQVVEDETSGIRVEFADHAFVRISEKKVQVFGDIQYISILLTGDQTPDLYVNGRLSRATVKEDRWQYMTRDRLF